MAIPQLSTEWASSNTTADYVIDSEGNTEIALNKTEPSTSYKESGIRAQTPAIRGYFNYWMNAVHQKLEWLIREEVGTILEFENGSMTKAQLESDRGGTWDDLGTISRAYSTTTTTVRGFKKSA